MSEQTQAKRELLTPGHYGCPGCGAVVAMRQTLSVLGEDTIVVMPAGCWSTMIGIYPYTSLTVPVVSVAFATTAATAAGIKAGYHFDELTLASAFEYRVDKTQNSSAIPSGIFCRTPAGGS